MVMSFKRILPAAAILSTLAACVPIGDSHLPGFGESVRYDAAVETINPAPVYAADAAQPGDNGDKGAQAVKRYRSDVVKPVEAMQTTSSQGGGSGSSPQ
jgi:hypothetical protein